MDLIYLMAKNKPQEYKGYCIVKKRHEYEVYPVGQEKHVNYFDSLEDAITAIDLAVKNNHNLSIY